MPKTNLCLIIGDPIQHSLSPFFHTLGYQACGLNDFVYFPVELKAEGLSSFMLSLKQIQNFRGMSITIPHKQTVMDFLDGVDDKAKRIGSVNTVLKAQNQLLGYNTDYQGVALPLQDFLATATPILPKASLKVALIGAGGASRSAGFAVVDEGMELWIFNRTLSKAKSLAEDISSKSACQVQAFGLDQISKIKDCHIIINSTAVGLNRPQDTPVDKKFLNSQQLVFDMVYKPLQTRLLREAREVGATTIDGLQMFVYQGLAQFELFTGQNFGYTFAQIYHKLKSQLN